MLRRSLISLLALLVFAAMGSAQAAGKTSITWYGHAAFKIVTPAGHVLVVDPWITNPSNSKGKDDLAALTKVDLILVTHGHGDHVGDAVDIAKRTGAQLVSNFDLGSALVADAGFPAAQAGYLTQGNAGGTVTLLDGDVSITFEPAVHGSVISVPGANGAPGQVAAAGSPGGFLIRIKDGPTIYHTGDTALFGDMKLIGDAHVDVMLACIGDHFTMGPDDAARAVELVHPKVVVPMHFATFPVLTGTPEAFEKAVKARHLKTTVKVMKIDEPVDF